MSLMTLLEQAQGGGLFANVARSLDLDEAQTGKAMRKLCPAIAARLKKKAEADDSLFQTLLDLVEDSGQGSPLDDPEALTNSEAISDGNAILDDVFGSRNAAMVALREVDQTIPERELSKLAPISATAVVAALAAANRPMALSAAALPASSAGSAGQGFVSALISAIIAGIVAALTKKLRTPTRRRSTGYARTRSRRKTTPAKSRTTTRRKSANASVEDLFKDILSNLGK
jgi:hypothetical protein